MKLSKTLGVATSMAFIATFAVALDSTDTTNANAETNAVTNVGAGTITGKVVFDGERPKIKPLTISADQSKGCCAPGTAMDDTDMSLLIAEDGGLANVVVTLEVKGAEKPKPAEKPTVLDQQGCRFVPHVVVVPEGTTVSFKNSDSLSHNIHTYSVKNEGVNVTVAAGKSSELKLEAAEQVKVACDIHPWMTSYVYVTDATHFTLTGADGSFKLEGVPAGEYKVSFQHESLGKGSETVTVKDDGSSDPMEVQLGKKKKKGGRGR